METGPQKFSMEDAKKIAATPAGKQLLSLLKQADKQNLQSALEDAKSGNYDSMRQKLEPLLASQQVQELLQKLGGK